MNIRITVKRQSLKAKTPYFQTFLYSEEENIAVAQWLSRMNEQEKLTDENGKPADRIAWECGCMERKCGACAMRINKIPMLACTAFLKDVAKKETILLEPLGKFPVIKDLIVDRNSMFEMLKHMKLWLSEKEWTDFGWDEKAQYKAGQCLMCGCCLEVCPNFLNDGTFSGAVGAVQAYKVIEQNSRDEHYDEMTKAYIEKFFTKCGQALSCQKVCPVKLPIDEIQARTNAHVVWKR